MSVAAREWVSDSVCHSFSVPDSSVQSLDFVKEEMEAQRERDDWISHLPTRGTQKGKRRFATVD